MNKYLIICIGLLLCFPPRDACAQHRSRDVIAACSQEAAADSIVLSWTVGQISAETRTFPDLIVTEGYQQPFLLTSIVWELPQTLKLTIFPNPATHSVLLEFEYLDHDLSCVLYDIVGQPVYEKVVLKGSHALRIPLLNLPGGIYLLHILNVSGEARGMYKIVKTL